MRERGACKRKRTLQRQVRERDVRGEETAKRDREGERGREKGEKETGEKNSCR